MPIMTNSRGQELMERTDQEMEQLNRKMAMMQAAAHASFHASGVLLPRSTHQPLPISPPRHR